MAIINKIECDICGEECDKNARYELTYNCLVKHQKEDICFTCMNQIKETIIQAKNK